MTDEPLVSIGLATYNRAGYLEKVLDHITNQTYTNLDIIISDDASTDRTPQVCRRFVAKDDRIRYIRQEERLGSLGNWGFVLGENRGKYFMWHADDDLLEPTFVERMVEMLEDDPSVALAFSDYRFIDEEFETIDRWTLDEIRPDRSWEEARRIFFQNPYFTAGVTIHGLYRSAVLNQIGHPKGNTFRRIASGMEPPFLAKVATRGKIVAVPEILFNYMEHRRDQESVAHTSSASLSWWELIFLHATIQTKIFLTALTASLPWSERLSLARTCLRSTIRRLTDEVAGREPPTPKTARAR